MISAVAVRAEPAPHRAGVIVTFDAQKIVVRDATGMANARAQRPVTADDPVRIASVSKLVVALAVMRLVERGQLDLDQDISAYLGWPVRNPGFPDRPITLRLLLSHQSSLRDGDDLYLIPLGDMLQARLSDQRVWDDAAPPGTFFRYANLNFPVIASIVERVTQMRFDAAMQTLVMTPLGLDACFNWTLCSDTAIGRAVTLYDAQGDVRRDDLAAQRPPCPVYTTTPGPCDLSTYRLGDNGALFSPQGGLRISMRDLARIGQMFLNQGQGFLKPASLRTMQRISWRFDGRNGATEGGFFCAFGLGLHVIGTGRQGCSSDGFGDGRRRIGHAGEAYGLRGGLWLDPMRRQGVAFFITAVPDDAPKGASGFFQVEEQVLQSPSAQPGK